MKKFFYILLFNFCFLNFIQAQEIFREDFETFDSRYGTNVINTSNQCPSISFVSNRSNLDCLVNWRTFAGTPSLIFERVCNYNRYIPPCIENHSLAMWSASAPSDNRRIIGEAAFINSVQFQPNKNYTIQYNYRVDQMKTPAPLNPHFYIEIANNLTPYYYNNAGECGTRVQGNRIRIESLHLPQQGTGGWQSRTIQFSTGSNSFNNLLFYPSTTENNASQVDINIDNIVIYDDGFCNNNELFLQNSTLLSNVNYEAQRIYSGRNVTTTIPSGDFNVAAGVNVSLIAYSIIDLEDGFTVDNGANFNADITETYPICYQEFRILNLEDESTNLNYLKDDTSENFSLFPNPSNGLFKIIAKETIDELLIYNSFGEEIKRFDNSEIESDMKIDLTNNKKGIYLVRILSNNQWTDKKVIIE